MAWEGLRADSTRLFPSLIEKFPPEDLAEVLCDLYFEHVNNMYPLLHRPTFLRQFRSRLHYRDHWFACLCLSIFAVASRWCDDPRVITDKFDGEGDLDWHRAGWQYFSAALGTNLYLCKVICS
jgi:Fungal specific transcription factor domain